MPENLPKSRRFKEYSRDKSKRGRSLALSQILANLKKQSEYADFEPVLRRAIGEIRRQGNPESSRRRVIESLKRFACEIDEIAEETNLPADQIKQICEQLVVEKLVRSDYRSDVSNFRGNQYKPKQIEIFFWIGEHTSKIA